MHFDKILYDFCKTDAQRKALEAIEEHGSCELADAALGRQRSYSSSMLVRVRGYAQAAGRAVEFAERQLVNPKQINPLKSKTRRFIFTSAQDESLVHDGFLDALEAYAEWLGDCRIMIAGVTYNKSVWQDGQSRPTAKREDAAFFAERVRPYLVWDRIDIGCNLAFCGEMNTLPTAVNPLAGFEAYTRDRWGIFPHAKQHLQCVATAKDAPTKQLFTTGSVTRPNYVQRKAGIQAEFHHVIGALIVEVTSDDRVFVRQLSTSKDGDGTFYALTRKVTPGGVTVQSGIAALNPGDIHHEKIDPQVMRATFGAGGVMDTLEPAHIFMHDLSDFAPRNHHNIKDPHFIFEQHQNGTDDVKGALAGCASFLAEVADDAASGWGGCVHVVQSNHDNALLRWLKTADYRDDPQNAVFFLRAQLYCYDRMSLGLSVDVFEHTMRTLTGTDERGDLFYFISEDQSFTIDGIEYGMHGHLGANGARGNPKTFAKVGKKSTTGHTHTPQIIGGAYVAGTSSLLDMGYNQGLSSWDHSHVIAYKDGHRAIITMKGGEFWPQQMRNK